MAHPTLPRTAAITVRAFLAGSIAVVALAAPAEALVDEDGALVELAAPIEDEVVVPVEPLTDADVIAAAPEWALPGVEIEGASLRAVDCGLPFRIGPPIYGWGRWYQICYDENWRYFIRRWW